MTNDNQIQMISYYELQRFAYTNLSFDHGYFMPTKAQMAQKKIA